MLYPLKFNNPNKEEDKMKLTEAQRADDLRQEEMAREDNPHPERKYNVGDSVWYASYNHKQVQKPCPVCFGKKQVVLILGNDERVALPCDYCGKGWDGPRGYITEYEYVAKANHLTITKVETKTDAVSEDRRYFFAEFYAEIQDLFDTEKEALARCTQKIEQQQTEDTTTAYRIKANHLKSYTWNAGYHLAQAQKHRKDAEYHDKKAILCKERIPAKGTTKEAK